MPEHTPEEAATNQTGQKEQPAQPKGDAALEDLTRFRAAEALTSLDAKGRRKWIYPAHVRGAFMRWRQITGYVLILVYFITPWLKVNGMQAILLQIPERRFILFGYVFWPQELFYLVFLLLGLALALFFFTALMGRLWCGWFCPQTVFMEEIFRKVEEWIEGTHTERARRDAGPMTLDKATRKVVKHGFYALFSAHVANTFIAYFVGVDNLRHWTFQSPTEHWTAFLIMAAITLVFYFDFAWFREQFCVVVCPYARFQSVLTDAHTLQVGYDLVRGEPRGKLGKTTGDCVDCKRCVAVCPTGIDIRDGFQLECIGCSRCIDACNDIMARVDKPKGLIRYDSLARLSGAATHWLRPRVVIYSVLLVATMVAMAVALERRPELDMSIVRPPGNPFQVLPGGEISNHFTLRLHNREDNPHEYTVKALGPTGLRLVLPGNPLTVGGNNQLRSEAFVMLPQGAVASGKTGIRFQVFRGSALLVEKHVTFLAPARN